MSSRDGKTDDVATRRGSKASCHSSWTVVVAVVSGGCIESLASVHMDRLLRCRWRVLPCLSCYRWMAILAEHAVSGLGNVEHSRKRGSCNRHLQSTLGAGQHGHSAPQQAAPLGSSPLLLQHQSAIQPCPSRARRARMALSLAFLACPPKGLTPCFSSSRFVHRHLFALADHDLVSIPDTPSPNSGGTLLRLFLFAFALLQHTPLSVGDETAPHPAACSNQRCTLQPANAGLT